MDTVDPCPECGRFVRSNDDACPFCGAPHEPPATGPQRSGLRSRLAVVAGAALLMGACGGGDAEGGGGAEGDSSSGGEVADGEGGGEGEELPDEEMSCAGRCGSHHHPDCMDDDPPCPAPPYGTPPIDDMIV